MATVADEVVNGSSTPATPSTPKTPKTHGLSMTEYSSNPTPPFEKDARVKRSEALSQIPYDFLLPNGFPDVSKLSCPLFRV